LWVRTPPRERAGTVHSAPQALHTLRGHPYMAQAEFAQALTPLIPFSEPLY
jgi:hypothetical protein